MHWSLYKRVSLKPGENEEITFTLTDEMLTYYNYEGKQKDVKNDFKVFVTIFTEERSELLFSELYICQIKNDLCLCLFEFQGYTELFEYEVVCKLYSFIIIGFFRRRTSFECNKSI